MGPTADITAPTMYRMRIFAPNEVVAVNEIYEKKPNVVKNYAAFVRYDSRSGTHNLYKEYRDTTRVGAVNQLYLDMAGRHRVRTRSVQIIDVKEIASKDCRRAYV